MKLPFPLLFLVLAAALTGCTTTPVAAAKKAGIKTVQVEPRIDFEAGMRYGAELSAPGLNYVLAGMVVNSLGQKGVSRMSAVMQTNAIVIADLVRSNVVSRLLQNPELHLGEGDSDAIFVVKVVQFGFEAPDLHPSRKYPFLVLRAELLNRAGKRLWSRQNTLKQITSKGLGATWEEYEAHPDKLRTDWNRQIENVVSHLLPAK